ncbi:MAG: 16S rRNA (guanine(527)-N(7))-methyltransferase RsmG [Anaerolineaceae bacterium]|nr:16S rRNA (guanine(527)-N(7))-methyltransferase RsmG [Anaerolineaceae bacterium]
MPFMEKFYNYLDQFLGIKITLSQINAFIALENLLLKWNEKINLTAITDLEGIYIKHFLDSLTCLRVIQNREAFSLIDIGTGAGFPGIPLKIILPDMQLTLVESSKKKAEFCKVVVNALNLSDTTVVSSRVEDLGKDPYFRENYDWAVARAVAELSVLAEYLLPLVKIGGKALAMKGADTEVETRKASHAVAVLGGEISERINLDLPEGYGKRTLVLLKKVSRSPGIYPRRAGMPTKKPIS